MSDFTQTPAQDGEPGTTRDGAGDTSIVPDVTADPVRKEQGRTEQAAGSGSGEGSDAEVPYGHS